METLGTQCPFFPLFSTFSLAELTRLGSQHHGFKSLLYAEWLTLLCLQPRLSLEFHCECITWLLSLLCHWNCSHRSQQPMSCPMQRFFLFFHLTHPLHTINKHCWPLSPWNTLFSHASLALLPPLGSISASLALSSLTQHGNSGDSVPFFPSFFYILSSWAH